MESETPNLAAGLHNPKTRRVVTLRQAELAGGTNLARSHMLKHQARLDIVFLINQQACVRADYRGGACLLSMQALVNS